jgi:hypothetical protein
MYATDFLRLWIALEGALKPREKFLDKTFKPTKPKQLAFLTYNKAK